MSVAAFAFWYTYHVWNYPKYYVTDYARHETVYMNLAGYVTELEKAIKSPDVAYASLRPEYERAKGDLSRKTAACLCLIIVGIGLASAAVRIASKLSSTKLSGSE